MFTTIYELLIGSNEDPTYADQIFSAVGLFTLIFAVVFCLIFYLLLGRWKPIFHKLFHWIITLVILIIISFGFALTQAKGAIGADVYDAYMIKFSMANALFVAIYFFVFSILLKKASIFAKRTPF
jgi:hypothetical protein